MLSEWLPSFLLSNNELQVRLISTLVIIFALWLLRLIVMQIVNRQVKGVRAQYSWRKTTTYLAAILGILLISPLWLSIQSVATFLGIAAAGLIIALAGPVNDVVAWLFILWRRPFEVGDRIEIGPHSGDVVDIRVFQFVLLEIGNWVHADQSTGRVLYIPNRKIFSDPVGNYHKGLGYIWHEIEVLITFESHWQKAKTILEEIVNRDAAHLSQDAGERIQRAARRFLIFYPHITPIVYTSVESSGVLLTMRYLCDPRRRRSTEQTLWEDILNAFAQQPDIEFAYPTQRFYQRAVKPNKQNNAAMPMPAGQET